MKRVGVMAICALVLLSAGVAQADAIDPVIIVRGGTGSINLTTTSISLLFPDPGNQGCANSTTTAGQYAGVPAGMPIMTCVFFNNGPAPLTSLVITFPAQGPLTVDCIGICSSFSGTNDNRATFIFNPPIPNTPVFPFKEFEITFVAFGAGTNFAGTFNTPEPGTLALLGTGLLAVASKLRRKKKV